MIENIIEKFNNQCEKANCSECEMSNDHNDNYKCYHQGFYIKGYQQGRADVIDEVFEKAYDIDMDSSLIYLRFDKEKFNVPFITRKCELKEWFREQLKEQNK